MKESSKIDSPKKLKEESPYLPKKKSKLLDDSLKPKKSFIIRAQKTFLFDPELKSSRLSINSSRRCSSKVSSEITKNKTKNKSKNFQSQNDLVEIEKNIKMNLQKQRRDYLWEARRQNYEENKKNIENKDKFLEIPNPVVSRNVLQNRNTLLNTSINNFLSTMTSNYLKKNNTNNEISTHTNTENNSQFYLKNSESNENIKEAQLPIFKSMTVVKKTEKKLNANQSYNKTDLPFGKTQLMQIYHSKIKKLCANEMLRKITHKKLLFDSEEESESDVDSEIEGNAIDPDTKFIFIFDSLLIIGSIYYLFYVTFSSAIIYNFCNCSKNCLIIFFNIFFEFVYIVDFAISFFRSYYSQVGEFSQIKTKLVKNNKKIVINFLSGWFTFDLISSIPIYFIGLCWCKKFNILFNFSFTTEHNNILFKALSYLKLIKMIKLFQSNKNVLYTKILDYLSKFEFFDNKLDLFKELILGLVSLHSMTCTYIFIGRHNYPSWIIKNKFINCSFVELYLSAFYYLLATMTTVGYGDIDFGVNNAELIYRIFLLTAGIIAYSYIITSISNIITKASYASMNYNKEAKILEEIRIMYPQLKFSTYLEIKKYIEFKNFHQQSKDKNILIYNLPFTLKNDLIIAMYQKQIHNFNFFKGVSNTNFVVEVLINFAEMIAVKNDVLIKEDETINEVFFVKDGRLALEVSIDLNDHEYSKNKYLNDDFLNYLSDHEEDEKMQIFTHSIVNETSDIGTKRVSINNINKIGGSLFPSEKALIKVSEKNEKNEIFLKIHEIHKNDDYGSLFLFLEKKSPFTLRVRSKNADLLILKKTHMNKILNNYKNIWKNIISVKKHNMSGIKKKIIKVIFDYFDINGIKTNDLHSNSTFFSP